MVHLVWWAKVLTFLVNETLYRKGKKMDHFFQKKYWIFQFLPILQFFRFFFRFLDFSIFLDFEFFFRGRCRSARTTNRKRPQKVSATLTFTTRNTRNASRAPLMFGSLLPRPRALVRVRDQVRIPNPRARTQRKRFLEPQFFQCRTDQALIKLHALQSRVGVGSARSPKECGLPLTFRKERMSTNQKTRKRAAPSTSTTTNEKRETRNEKRFPKKSQCHTDTLLAAVKDQNSFVCWFWSKKSSPAPAPAPAPPSPACTQKCPKIPVPHWLLQSVFGFWNFGMKWFCTLPHPTAPYRTLHLPWFFSNRLAKHWKLKKSSLEHCKHHRKHRQAPRCRTAMPHRGSTASTASTAISAARPLFLHTLTCDRPSFGFFVLDCGRSHPRSERPHSRKKAILFPCAFRCHTQHHAPASSDEPKVWTMLFSNLISKSKLDSKSTNIWSPSKVHI